jgi:hypothetical protein
MKRLLAWCLWLAAGVQAAENPGPSRCYSIYNPVGMGTEWEYRGETRSSSRQGQDRLTRSQNRQRVVALTPDSVRVSWAWTYTDVGSGSVTPQASSTDYTCGDDGVVMVGYRGSMVPPRSDVGTKWEYTSESVDAKDGRGFRSVRRHEVVGTEPVVVAAGQFEAIKVAWEHEMIRIDPDPKELARWRKLEKDSQTIMKGFEWYAPHVGLVRRSYETTTLFKGKQESRSEGADELIAFRP